MKRRVLNVEESEEAQRLAAAWISYKEANKGVTQEWLGAETGLGTQGAVGQYLRGVIPLNVEALMAFARVLGVDPRTISPRLANIVGVLMPPAAGASAAGGEPDPFQLTIETAEELRALSAFRLSNERERRAFNGIIGAVLDRVRVERRNEG